MVGSEIFCELEPLTAPCVAGNFQVNGLYDNP